MNVVVTAHAVDRYRQRTGNAMPFILARVEIARLVRDAAEAKQVLDHKPKSWRLYGETKRHARLLAGQRFVGDPAGDVAWIVLVDGETWTVMTTLLRPVFQVAPPSVEDDLRTEDAEAYPVGSPKWLALTDADVDSQRDRARGK